MRNRQRYQKLLRRFGEEFESEYGFFWSEDTSGFLSFVVEKTQHYKHKEQVKLQLGLLFVIEKNEEESVQNDLEFVRKHGYWPWEIEDDPLLPLTNDN